MTEPSEPELATKRERLGAAAVDALLFALPYGLIKAGLGPASAATGGVLLVGLTVLQFWLLAARGQSLGKIALKIRIVLLSDGANGGFFTNVVKRTIFSGLLNLIPLYWIVDCCFIFRQDRRCVHDFIASTRVVRVVPAAGA